MKLVHMKFRQLQDGKSNICRFSPHDAGFVTLYHCNIVIYHLEAVESRLRYATLSLRLLCDDSHVNTLPQVLAHFSEDRVVAQLVQVPLEISRCEFSHIGVKVDIGCQP